MWFDGQATEFDDYAGLDPTVARGVGQAILDASGASDDDVILDIGAGTGAIGCHFAALPNPYVGLELSPGMLAIFRRKLDPLPLGMCLAQADCDHPWPVGARTVHIVFASRVVHHLTPARFLEETQRVCRAGGYLFLGRVTREPGSLPSRLQRYKRTLLAEHGFSPPGGEQSVHRVLDASRALGAEELPTITAARWMRTATPRQLLANWEGKPQLTSGASGRKMDAEKRAAMVESLTAWARTELGDLDQPQEFEQQYKLYGVRLP